MGLVLERIRESRTLIHFVRERLPHYGPLASSDLRLLGEEIVKATVGACIALVAGVIFACFLSMAAIVLAWNGLHPIAAAWLALAPWGLRGECLSGCLIDLRRQGRQGAHQRHASGKLQALGVRREQTLPNRN